MENLTVEEFANRLLRGIAVKKQRHGHFAVSGESLEAVIKAALSGEEEEEWYKPAPMQPAPIRKAYPKTKLRIDPKTKQVVETIQVNSIEEERPYMSGGWYTDRDEWAKAK